MNKDVAVIAVHGMGDAQRDFAEDLKEELVGKLGQSKWNRVHFDTIFYSHILQSHEKAVFESMRKKVDYVKLRKFLLYGISDAAGLERNAHLKNSPYQQAQEVIRETLVRCGKALGDFKKPVILVAHSLGCQVLSNYIWDSQSKSPGQGIWKGKKPTNTLSDKFYRFKTLRAFYTTGCNIPIFVAGFPKAKINAVTTNGKGYNFLWHNFYDEDDVLGWPLKPLSPSYKQQVYRDHEINAGGGFFSSLWTSWNPLSHNGYWSDREFLKPLTVEIDNHL
ncbi:MAG: hypothetical protein ACYSUT_09705 [Planctomycetota bacterium]|jgi:hypothetical protein